MLTQSKPIQKQTTRNGTCLVIPVIGLQRVGKYSDAGKFNKKIKCRTNPIYAFSTTYKIGMAYFKDGTPKSGSYTRTA